MKMPESGLSPEGGREEKHKEKSAKRSFLQDVFFQKGYVPFLSVESPFRSFHNMILHASFRVDYFVFVLYFVFAILFPLKERAGNADGASLKAGCQSAGGVFGQHASYFGCHVLRCD